MTQNSVLVNTAARMAKGQRAQEVRNQIQGQSHSRRQGGIDHLKPPHAKGIAVFARSTTLPASCQRALKLSNKQHSGEPMLYGWGMLA